jgi:cytochrome c556
MKRSITFGPAALCAALAMTAALAEDPQTPQQQAQAAVDLRQGLQKLMGFEMAPLGEMLKNKKPVDALLVAKNAANIAALGSMQPEVFALDTHQFNLHTKANEGIWTHKSDFDAKSDALVRAANEVVAVAKTGDRAATIKAIGAMGKMTCSACHDSFRDN